MEALSIKDGESQNIVEENIEALKSILPDAFTEDGIDFDVLRQLLGDDVADGEEKYGLTWHGKKKARQIALTPSAGTLRPCPEESVEWDRTKNIFIEGDNLEVLKLLQKSYAGRVKVIYIDPPYNKDKDFVYPDKFQDNLDTYLRYTGQISDDGMKFSSNTEAGGRKHTNWASMIYPRLKLARSLLRKDGAIFISIDDNEVNVLKAVCDEIFGEENFVAQIVWQKSKKGDAKLIASVHEYIVCYAKDKAACIEAGVWRNRKDGVDDVLHQYNEIRRKHYPDHEKIREKMMAWYRGLEDDDPRKSHKHYNWSDERGLYFPDNFAGPDDGRESRPRHDILHPVTGKSCKKPSTGWRWDEPKTKWALEQDPPRIHFGPDETTIPNRKSYLKETAFEPYPSHFYQDGRSATLQVEKLLGPGVFTFPKNTQVLGKLINLLATDDDLIADFFAGSGSTGHACMIQNLEEDTSLRYMLVQLPEHLDGDKNEQKAAFRFCKENHLPANIAEIGKERLRRAAKELRDENPEFQGDLGFKVFKLDSSNIRAWNPDAADLEQTLLDHAEHLVEGRSEQDVLYELLLKRGVDLAVPIEEKTIAEKAVYSIGYGVLFACLSTSIAKEEIEALGKGITDWHKALAPDADTQVVFRDSAFADDIAKTNMTAILEQNGIAHVRSL